MSAQLVNEEYFVMLGYFFRTLDNVQVSRSVQCVGPGVVLGCYWDSRCR